MNVDQQISTEALDAIENLTEAADAFVRALQHAANQDTHNRGYWTGFIAQIKHVAEHGGAALRAPEAELVPAPDGSANRARMDALFDARQALEGASELTFHASVLFGRNDHRVKATR
jgi:hypothetical protein